MNPEGNSWKLCQIGGHAYEDSVCFNCGASNRGDYDEGFEKGFADGRKDAIREAATAASRPAGNRLMDFASRQQIIVQRVWRIQA